MESAAFHHQHQRITRAHFADRRRHARFDQIVGSTDKLKRRGLTTRRRAHRAQQS
jgi:hypothetical protein